MGGEGRQRRNTPFLNKPGNPTFKRLISQESGQDQPRPWRPRGRGRGRGGHGGDRDKSKIGGQTVEEIREEVRQAKLHKEQQNSKVDNKEDSPKPAGRSFWFLLFRISCSSYFGSSKNWVSIFIRT